MTDGGTAQAGRRITTIKELQRHVGQEIGVGDWRDVTQERIDAFAEVTGDHQWIHVDPERCRAAGLGGTIAHGYLTLSLLTLLRQSLQGISMELPAKMGVNYGSDRVRFINPVPAGGRSVRVTAPCSITGAASRSGPSRCSSPSAHACASSGKSSQVGRTIGA